MFCSALSLRLLKCVSGTCVYCVQWKFEILISKGNSFEIYRVVHSNLPIIWNKFPRLILILHGRVICHINWNFVSFKNMCEFERSDLEQSLQASPCKTRHIWLMRTWNLTLNFEAVWGHYALQRLRLVNSHPNIVLHWYFFTSGWLEIHRPYFATKARILTFQPLISIEVWG